MAQTGQHMNSVYLRENKVSVHPKQSDEKAVLSRDVRSPHRACGH